MSREMEPADLLATTVSEPARWEARLCTPGDLPQPGASIVREVSGRRVAIFNVAGTLYAVDDLCTHAHSSLSEEGCLSGLVIECALHRAQFDIASGRALCGPTRKHLRTYDLRMTSESVTAVEALKVRGGGPS